MAGGAGKRLWPVSGPGKPKPLFRLPGRAATLLEETVGYLPPLGPPASGGKNPDDLLPPRLRGGPGWGPSVLVATSAPFAEAIRSARAVPEECLIVEPLRKDTSGCAALGLATLLAQGTDPDRATVGFLNTDVVVGDGRAYGETIRTAYEAAEEHGTLVCMGIRPTRAETGFGYIEVASEVPLSLGEASLRPYAQPLRAGRGGAHVLRVQCREPARDESAL